MFNDLFVYLRPNRGKEPSMSWFVPKTGGCSVMAARKTSDLDSAYLQCAGAGSIPVTRSTRLLSAGIV